MKARVLLVDDDQDQCDLLAAQMTRLDCAVTSTTSPSEALELAAKDEFDVVVTDLGMEGMSGSELCSRIGAVRPDVPVLVVTALGSMHTAIAAMRAGSYDFLTKPVDASLLGIALTRALQHRRLREEVRRLRASAEEDRALDDVVGKSAAMQRIASLVTRVASSDATVLVCGETGTGKELVARAIHGASSRRDGPFVAINCAAVPTNLLESELFGHARGAFTDAKAPREGLFMKASGGTLFLDEIGEMPLDMQAKLLRALQERTVRPVGSDVESAFDTRIVAATHRDLEVEVSAKRFREDLYYRINVVALDVPPLRDRAEDIVPLATHFLRRTAEKQNREEVRLSPEVARILLSYDWPGNVRELENCMERAVALARHNSVSAEDLPDRIRAARAGMNATPQSLVAATPDAILPLAEVERRHILHVLKLLEGNRVRTAEVLGLDRRTLYRRLEKYAEEACPAAETARQASASDLDRGETHAHDESICT